MQARVRNFYETFTGTVKRSVKCEKNHLFTNHLQTFFVINVII